jgi:hypothetical protein
MIATLKDFSKLHKPSMTSPKEKNVAVLYQDLEPPVINSVQKPKKPGGELYIERSWIHRTLKTYH